VTLTWLVSHALGGRNFRRRRDTIGIMIAVAFVASAASKLDQTGLYMQSVLAEAFKIMSRGCTVTAAGSLDGVRSGWRRRWAAALWSFARPLSQAGCINFLDELKTCRHGFCATVS
jgi:hypothetical protein